MRKTTLSIIAFFLISLGVTTCQSEEMMEYLKGISMQGSLSELIGPVENLTADSQDGQVVLSWTNPDNVRFQAAVLCTSTEDYPIVPMDCIPLLEEDNNTYTHTGLENWTTYYYTVWAMDNINKYAVGVNTIANPRALVYDFKSEPKSSTEVELSWTLEDYEEIEKLLIVRNTTGAVDEPADGETVYEGKDNTFTDTGREVDITYYYTGFLYDIYEEDFYQIVSDDCTLSLLNPVSDFTANEISSTEIELSWTNPTDATFDHVIIRRGETDFPDTIADGELVYNGSAETTIDSGLSIGTMYYYSIFAIDSFGNISTKLEKQQNTCVTNGNWTPGGTIDPGPYFTTTFSGPMNQSSVENIDNYTIDTTGVSIVEISYEISTYIATYTIIHDDTAGTETYTIAPSSSIIDVNGYTLDAITSPTYTATSDSISLRDIGPAGGLIFYDKGYYSDGWRYLEAAPSTTYPSYLKWGCVGTDIGSTLFDIGAGQLNTTAIVAGCAETNISARFCDELIVNNGGTDYIDWFLPSKEELNLMYINLQSFGVGDFIEYTHASSSEENASSAWVQNFPSGEMHTLAKHDGFPNCVRAARAF